MKHDLNRRPAQHIAMFTRALSGGGVGRVMFSLASAFADHGHRVDLLLSEVEGPYLGRLPASTNIVRLEAAPWWSWRLSAASVDYRGLRTHLLPVLVNRNPSPMVRFFPSLSEYLKRERPDVLLSAVTYSNLAALWARRSSGVPTRVVISEHTNLAHAISYSKKWKWRFLPPAIRRFYPWADDIIAVSNGAAASLAELTGLNPERINTIYNPVFTQNLREMAQATPDHPWLAPAGPPVVLSAGRFRKAKDFATLLRAFAQVRAEREAKLIILGEGRKRGSLESLVQELGLAADVDLPGYTENPFSYMARVSVFVLSSVWEGLPTVLIEAMACGCPVVSTDCPSGPAEILADGIYGPLVQVGDDAALARAILATLDEPPASAMLRARADEFSIDRAINQYLKVLFGTE